MNGRFQEGPIRKESPTPRANLCIWMWWTSLTKTTPDMQKSAGWRSESAVNPRQMLRKPCSSGPLYERSMKPEFVDNRQGNTLVATLRGHLDWLAATYARPVEVSIASGYFNPEGFGLLADQLEWLARVRLLLGAEPTPPPAKPRRRLGEAFQRYDARVVREAVQRNTEGLLHDSDLREFSPGTEAAVRRLLSVLESERIEVRRYERG